MKAMKLVDSCAGDGKSILTQAEKPKAVKNTLRKLHELAELQDNWDSYDAKSPTNSALLAAAELAYDLFTANTPSPDIFPVPNGNIQFEWSCFGLDIEIEIESNRCHTQDKSETQWYSRMAPMEATFGVKFFNKVYGRAK